MLNRILFLFFFILCIDILNGYRVKKNKPPKADCLLAGHKHGDKWEDTLLPKCKQYKCINGVVHNIYSGCIYQDSMGKEKCYGVNERWKEGCSSRVCSYVQTEHNGRTAHMYIVDGQPRCVTQNMECKSPGDSWEFECEKYTCKQKDLMFMKVATIEKLGHVDDCYCCQFEGKCYNNGTIWPGKNCTVLSCGLHYSADNKKIIAALAIIPGCDYGGKCYDFGSKIVDNCCVKECKLQEGTKNVFWHTINTGCSYGGKCLYPTEYVRNASQCMQYTCNSDGSVTSKVYGCQYKNKCIPFGETGYDDECYFKKCFLDDGTALLTTIRGACLGINNKCYDYGDTGFSKEIRGKVYHNCKCEKKGNTGSLATCEASQPYGKPVYVEVEGVGYNTGVQQGVKKGESQPVHGSNAISSFLEQRKTHQHVYAHDGILNGEINVPDVPKGEHITHIGYVPPITSNQNTNTGVLGNGFGPNPYGSK